MSEQNTPMPSPLTTDEEGDLRFDADNGCFDAGSGQRLFATLDASRAECAALRESLAEAERRSGFKDAEFETVIAEVKRERAALAAELAEARTRNRGLQDMLASVACREMTPEQVADMMRRDAEAALAARDSGKASGGGGE